MFVGRGGGWLAIGLAALLMVPALRAENLDQAWEVALHASHELEAAAESVT